MKIIVIGGSGLIGSGVVRKLRDRGHESIAASPKSGVNTLTGEGLAEILKGAQVVVDVSNSPSFEDVAVMEFFKTSTRNLLTYEAAAGVGHHVALSIVGTDRLPENGYFRAKIAQEKLIKESSVPYTIVRATQFFEFVKGIADEATHGSKVRVAPVLFQPIAADDVASAVARVALDSPSNRTVEVAGPEAFRFDEFIRQNLQASNDPREVITDPRAGYFGSELTERSLVPDEGAQLGQMRFAEWLKSSTLRAHAGSCIASYRWREGLALTAGATSRRPGRPIVDAWLPAGGAANCKLTGVGCRNVLFRESSPNRQKSWPRSESWRVMYLCRES